MFCRPCSAAAYRPISGSAFGEVVIPILSMQRVEQLILALLDRRLRRGDLVNVKPLESNKGERKATFYEV